MARQPLAELPLASYVVAYDRGSEKDPAALIKRTLSPSSLLSPPKRRILSEEGFAIPSKSPAKRLFFNSTPMEGVTSSLLHAATSEASSRTSSSSSSGSSSSGSTPSLVHSPRTSSPSSSAPSTPRVTRSRSRQLAPSPEITDSPMEITSPAELIVPLRPGSLKRLRSDGPSGGTSPAKSPTPKRRNVTRESSPAVVITPGTDEDDGPEDKENVPPPRKKRAAPAFKAPLPVVQSPKDPSATPRASSHRGGSPSAGLAHKLRARRAVMEAEVDMPDADSGVF